MLYSRGSVTDVMSVVVNRKMVRGFYFNQVDRKKVERNLLMLNVNFYFPSSGKSLDGLEKSGLPDDFSALS